jgi:hypothetical protein
MQSGPSIIKYCTAAVRRQARPSPMDNFLTADATSRRRREPLECGGADTALEVRHTLLAKNEPLPATVKNSPNPKAHRSNNFQPV